MLNKLFNMETLNQVGRYLAGEANHDSMSAWQKVPQQLRVSAPKGKPFVDETNKLPAEKTIEETVPTMMKKREVPTESNGISLQEAIIWSEILGKPMCKRRKDRNRFV